jgi:hypothetical protein
MTPTVVLADVSQLFQRFDSDAGSDGAARDRFQMLVTDLVRARHPDATTVEGPGNRDWGIDTFRGQLAGGAIHIWQSKYILEWQTDDPQRQVRDSFRSAVKHAAEHRYKITAWTLVVPCKLHPKQYQWFTGWAQRQSRETGIAINIWDGVEIRHQLMTQDALHVRHEYFAHTLAPMTPTQPTAVQMPVARTEDLGQFKAALFVRQLTEAGHVETDSACAHFFATDALVRDLEAKGQAEETAAMEDLHLEVQDIWEGHFNAQVGNADENGRIPGLVTLVVNGAAACENPPGLHLAKAHRKGTAHRIVEKQRAGWVKHWRDVATEHFPPTALAPATLPTSGVDRDTEVVVAGAVTESAVVGSVREGSEGGQP